MVNVEDARAEVWDEDYVRSTAAAVGLDPDDVVSHWNEQVEHSPYRAASRAMPSDRRLVTFEDTVSVPVGSVAIDRDGAAWTRHRNYWDTVDNTAMSDLLVAKYGPLTLVHVPGDPVVPSDHSPSPATTEDARKVLEAHRLIGARCRCGMEPRLDYYRYENHVAEALAASGLLATAPHTATTEWGVRQDDKVWMTHLTEAEARKAAKSYPEMWTVVSREVTAWTEADRG